jgi:ABC-type spermidine/putrescine transport system permease subunit II
MTPTESRRPPDLLTGLMWFWGAAVLLFLLLPIVTISVYAFNGGRALGGWEGFSLNPFRQAFTDPAIAAAVGTSAEAALGSAVVATVLGTLGGIATARATGRAVMVFTVLISLVLVTPEIVNAIALLIWYVRIGGPFSPGPSLVDYGLMRLWVGHALFSTAVVVLVVRARLSGVGTALEEAAADLYAPAWRTFTQITLRSVAPAIFSGFVLAFTLSMDNTIISSFVSVSGSTPWPVFVLSAIRSGLRPAIAAVSVCLLALTLLAAAVVTLTLKGFSGYGSANTKES